MFEIIKKGLLTSLGAAVVTRERIIDVSRRWVEEGKITKEEAERMVQELMTSGQSQWEEMQAKIAETVRKGLDAMDIARLREFQELKARVENLEKRCAILEDAAGGRNSRPRGQGGNNDEE